MREIKVRAWDSEEKVMVYDSPPFIRITNIGALKLDPHLVENRYYIVEKKLELMQYTGLKDKNGKEIFESDVINVCHMLVETVAPYRAVVEWDKYRYAIRNLNKQDYNAGYFLFNNLDPLGLDIEIIGNIHDNPELLK